MFYTFHMYSSQSPFSPFSFSSSTCNPKLLQALNTKISTWYQSQTPDPRSGGSSSVVVLHLLMSLGHMDDVIIYMDLLGQCCFLSICVVLDLWRFVVVVCSLFEHVWVFFFVHFQGIFSRSVKSVRFKLIRRFFLVDFTWF